MTVSVCILLDLCPTQLKYTIELICFHEYTWGAFTVKTITVEFRQMFLNFWSIYIVRTLPDKPIKVSWFNHTVWLENMTSWITTYITFDPVLRLLLTEHVNSFGVLKWSLSLMQNSNYTVLYVVLNWLRQLRVNFVYNLPEF